MNLFALQGFRSIAEKVVQNMVHQVVQQGGQVHLQMDVWSHKRAAYMGILVSGCVLGANGEY